ncbi:MAG: L,D-transpeptidase family protein [Rhodospirillales bacterium]|nr:L,D-transpeptidase family protein [Rhodospirillales bacterium]
MAATRLLFLLSILVTLPVSGRAVERSDIVGTLGYHVTQSGEVLAELAVQHDLGYVELRAANPGVVSWFPEIGTRLVLPKAHILPAATRRGIVVNLAEMRLYFFPPDGAPVQTYPVGIGREAFKTPLGETQVVNKRVNPTWVPPPSVRAEKPDLPRSVPPGPDNPLGAYSLDLGWPAYRIHGTNKPLGVGRRISHGCLRMYPWDVEALFPRVPVGTPVTVVDQPFKVGWLYGELYLEVHPSQRQADDVEITGNLRPEPLDGLIEAVRVAAGRGANQVDWSLVRLVAAERRGYPIRITTLAASPGMDW